MILVPWILKMLLGLSMIAVGVCLVWDRARNKERYTLIERIVFGVMGIVVVLGGGVIIHNLLSIVIDINITIFA